jgi:hypothetical protein
MSLPKKNAIFLLPKYINKIAMDIFLRALAFCNAGM